jgi:uncharacterized membrane protein
MYKVALPLIVVAMLLAWAPVAAIQEATPEPEWRYRVSGIPADGTLNVRARAGTTSDVVGRLEGDAAGIVVTGVRQEVRGSVWWQIVFPDAMRGTGWVNARYLTPQDPGAERETGFPLACSGTEPFWSLRLADGTGIMEQMDGERASWGTGDWLSARGRWGRYAVPLTAEDGRTGYTVISRTYHFCSDGMSDMQYPYDATIITPADNVLGGCCRRLR